MKSFVSSAALLSPGSPETKWDLSGLKLGRLSETRTKDGALISVRIPVTNSNRRLLRALRAAELAAWESTSNVRDGN